MKIILYNRFQIAEIMNIKHIYLKIFAFQSKDEYYFKLASSLVWELYGPNRLKYPSF
jgi:hypothetical protein